MAFLFLLVISTFGHVAAADPAAPFGRDPAWLALLHFSGSHSSISQKSNFFLDPNGAKDPAAELAATRAFFESNPEAPCRYPARARYLGWNKPGAGELCERWAKWRDAIRPKGLELVFASAFLNSPASMYGHTLLKFPRSGETEGQELLDYTLNYGANTHGSAGVTYIWLGLFGGFDGVYSTEPFYLKVKEYNFVENRDFWIYPLLVEKRELDLLLAHAWEMRDVPLPYYFLRKNCSFYLLEFLEVARPGQGLTKSFPLWSVPVDTIRRLKDKGWVGEPRLRVSRAKKLAAEFAELSGAERGVVQTLAKGEDAGPLPKGREARLLDASYDLWRYRTEAKGQNNSATENFLLRERSKYPERPQEFSFRETPPDLGHRSSRIGLFGGANKDQSFAELQYRGTFHDLLAPPEGYEPFGELTMGDFHARFENHRLFLDRVDVLRIRALAPRSLWFPRFAWSFKFGWDRAKEMRCADWRCGRGLLNGGGGISYQLGSALVFALAELDLEAGGVFGPNYRIAVGPSAGVFLPLWKGARALLETEYRWRLLGEHRQRRPIRAGLSQTLSTNWEIRSTAEANRDYREASLGFLHYF